MKNAWSVGIKANFEPWGRGGHSLKIGEGGEAWTHDPFFELALTHIDPFSDSLSPNDPLFNNLQFATNFL